MIIMLAMDDFDTLLMSEGWNEINYGTYMWNYYNWGPSVVTRTNLATRPWEHGMSSPLQYVDDTVMRTLMTTHVWW